MHGEVLQHLLRQLESDAKANDQLFNAVKTMKGEYDRKAQNLKKLVDLWQGTEFIPQRYMPPTLSYELLQNLRLLSEEAQEQEVELPTLWSHEHKDGILPVLMQKSHPTQKRAYITSQVVRKAREQLRVNIAPSLPIDDAFVLQVDHDGVSDAPEGEWEAPTPEPDDKVYLRHASRDGSNPAQSRLHHGLGALAEAREGEYLDGGTSKSFKRASSLSIEIGRSRAPNLNDGERFSDCFAEDPFCWEASGKSDRLSERNSKVRS